MTNDPPTETGTERYGSSAGVARRAANVSPSRAGLSFTETSTVSGGASTKARAILPRALFPIWIVMPATRVRGISATIRLTREVSIPRLHSMIRWLVRPIVM